ncbi:MAG: helix-turn-helix domain-containing protein [Dehalococcoidia bacterium]|jgi:excisionase family DNA binding protein
MEEKFWKTSEIAKMLGVTRRTIYSWIKDGKLQSIKIGGSIRIKQQDLDKFMGKQND